MDLTNAQYTKIKNLITSSTALTRSGFDTALRTALGFERWETKVNKTGFAGINLIAPSNNRPARIEIIWTTDGINGYPLNFETLKDLRSLVQNYLNTL